MSVPQLEVNTSHIQQSQSAQSGQNTGSTTSLPTAHADVRLVVLDGIVMGPNVWLYFVHDIILIIFIALYLCWMSG